MLIILILLFIVVWLVGGGISQVTGKAAGLNAFFSRFAHTSASETGAPGGLFGLFSSPDTDNVYFKLPWQPDLPTGPTLEEWTTTDQTESAAPVRSETNQFGTPSPSHAAVRIEGIFNGGQEDEYVLLRTDTGADITGWSLQNVRTGRRVYITAGAPDFRMGVINTVDHVALSSAGSVVINTGQSPTGVSFRENVCTGYLELHQPFFPSLTPAQVNDAQSYTDCANTHRGSGGYLLTTWRVYLGEARPLWSEATAVRLLDADGRIVDSYSY